jgi:hypothetical protein
MIQCLICNKEYKKILSTHLSNHGITKEEYLKKYPNALLIDEVTRQKYSQSTSKYYNTLSDIEKKARTYIRTNDIKQKSSKSSKEWFNSNPDYINRYSDKRNNKISNSKKIWWESISKEDRTLMLRHSQAVFKSRIGEDVYNKIKRKNGSKAKEKFDSQNNIIHSSSFELEMYKFLSENNISYIPQFNVNGWYFDCYIPDKNLLVEFDGDFWHPLTLADCKYDFQIKRLHTDKFKSNVAISNGFNLKKIRLSEKYKIKELL